jgi:PilZ domain
MLPLRDVNELEALDTSLLRETAYRGENGIRETAVSLIRYSQALADEPDQERFGKRQRTNMAERRVATRYPLILSAEVSDLASGTQFIARTADLSRTGCYIDTLNPLPAGSKVCVRLQNEAETFQTNGRVIYISPGLGMGVAFTSQAPGQLAILDRWLTVAAAVK